MVAYHSLDLFGLFGCLEKRRRSLGGRGELVEPEGGAGPRRHRNDLEVAHEVILDVHGRINDACGIHGIGQDDGD